jgi:hypothetical protein
MFPVILKIKSDYFLKRYELVGFVIETLWVFCDVRTGFLNVYLSLGLKIAKLGTSAFRQMCGTA